MQGPGKYDDICTMARVMSGAAACVVVVLGGDQGSGFSCQAVEAIPADQLADMLEDIARQLRADAAAEAGA